MWLLGVLGTVIVSLMIWHLSAADRDSERQWDAINANRRQIIETKERLEGFKSQHNNLPLHPKDYNVYGD